MLRHRSVGQVARREHVQRRDAVDGARPARLGEVGLEERAMGAGQPTKRVESFHDARALRPAASGTGSERHDRGFAGGQCGLQQHGAAR